MLIPLQERQRKLEQEVVVAEEELLPEVVESAPPVKEPSGPLTLAQVAAANVTEVDEPSEPVVCSRAFASASVLKHEQQCASSDRTSNKADG